VVQERSDYMRFLWNSVIVAGGSTLLGIIVAVPAAWSMAFVPSRAHQGHSALDALHKDAASCWRALSDLAYLHSAGTAGHPHRTVLVLMLINLPIIVWMLYTYFREIPGEILEAAVWTARAEGGILYVLTPMAIRASRPPSC
jgi:sorbitol/mannitol transport system permease protein